MKTGAQITINERLKQFLKGLPGTFDEIAEKTDISRSALFKITKPGGSIKSDYLLKFEEVYGLDPASIFHGTKNRTEYTKKHFSNYVSEPVNELNEDEFFAVPFYPQVKASAGAGLVPVESKAPLQIAFRKYYISNKLQCQASDLVAIKVDGDSMSPTLQDDDVILIDRSKARPQSGKMLVIRIDDAINVKRMQELPGHRLRVMSDNAAYESFEIAADAEGFEILGQVVWYARDLV